MEVSKDVHFSPLDRLYLDKGIQEALTFLNREDAGSSPFLPSRFHGINNEILSPVTRGLINYETLSKQDYYLNTETSLDALNSLALGFQFDVNKTRLLMAVVREAVKNKEDPEHCIFYLGLYRKVLEGSPAQTRNLLVQKFHLTILADKPLNTQSSGFDDRVYENFSLGKRTALQVLVDAYIKGLSRITIVHINGLHTEIVPLVLDAGRMLGINVEFALEFSHGRGNGKQNFLLYFPGCSTLEDYLRYLDSESMKNFLKELSKVSRAREKAVLKEIRRFNHKVRPGLNKGFEKYPELVLESVSLDHLLKNITVNQLSIPSLGHYLYEKYGEILKKRMESFDLDEFAPIMGRLRKIKNDEVSSLVEKLERLDQEYNKMDHESFTAKYLSDDLEISVAIPGFSDHLRRLRHMGLDVILALPLRHGLPSFLESLLRYSGAVNGIELFNTKYFFSHRSSEGELKELIELVNIYNQGAVKTLFHKARSYGLVHDKGDRFKIMLSDAAMHLLEEDQGLKIKMGSGSNDYSIASPGMGFLIPRISLLGIRSSLTGLTGHYTLPFRLGEVPEYLPFPIERTVPLTILSRLFNSTVILLGNPTAFEPKRKKEGKISLWNRIRSANSFIRNSILILLGVLLSLTPVKGTIHPAYIFLWFVISIFQSVLSDLISHGGKKIRQYRMDHINIKDLASYLFYTGMAIPILGSISFYISRALLSGGFRDSAYSFLLFISLGIASWIYTGTTTLLRGYKPLTALVNGARSFYSFPLAALSSMILPLPPIVQQKIWTAIAGALVEGFAKFREDLRLRRDDYSMILREIHSNWTTDRRIHCLLYDLLYIRGRMPRGKDVFPTILKESSKEEKRRITALLEESDFFKYLLQEELDSKYRKLHSLLIQEREEMIRLIKLSD